MNYLEQQYQNWREVKQIKSAMLRSASNLERNHYPGSDSFTSQTYSDSYGGSIAPTRRKVTFTATDSTTTPLVELGIGNVGGNTAWDQQGAMAVKYPQIRRTSTTSAGIAQWIILFNAAITSSGTPATVTYNFDVVSNVPGSISVGSV